MKIEVNIPEKINDLKLSQYQKFNSIVKEGDSDEFVNRKALEIFYGINPVNFTKIKVKDVNLMINTLYKVLAMKVKLVNRFTFNGVEYGLIPNFDDMTLGEFADLEKYVELKDLHKAMSILYRPITERQGKLYTIKKYEGANEKLSDMPLGVALSCVDFFFNIGLQLSIATLKSLKETEKQAKQKQDLVINGLGTVLSIPYRMGIFSKWKKQETST